MVAIAEAGVVLDVLVFGIDGTKLLANALDERADIGTIALVAIAGGEVLAVNEVVDLAIGDVLAGAACQQRQDLELGQGQVDRPAGPARAIDVETQLETAEMQYAVGLSAC